MTWRAWENNRLPQRPQRNIPESKYVRAARVLVTERAAMRANTRSRSAGVMIAGRLAGPITCPRCSRSPAIRPERRIWRAAGVRQDLATAGAIPDSLSQTVSDLTDWPSSSGPPSHASRPALCSASRRSIMSGALGCASRSWAHRHCNSFKKLCAAGRNSPVFGCNEVRRANFALKPLSAGGAGRLGGHIGGRWRPRRLTGEAR